MLIQIELKKSNFSEVKDLTKRFNSICLKFCKKIKDIEQKLKDAQAKEASN